MRSSELSTHSHSNSHTRSFPKSPEMDDGFGSPTSSYDHVDGPWDKRARHFKNVLLHVCSFILILEFAERLSYYGINQGLKNYMGILNWSQVGSNSLKSTWTSICYLSPLLGGYVADEKWGRFRTLWVFGVWYTIGAFLIAVSAYPTVLNYDEDKWLSNVVCHIGLFGFVAIATGAIKANVITFGADQFDPNDPNEVTQKEKFFSYFYIVINLGAIFSYSYLSWLCVNGFGSIPADYGYFANFLICGGIMVFAYALFFIGTPRFVHFPPTDSALTKLWTIIKGNCAYSYEARMLYYGLLAFAAAFPLNLLAAFLSDVLNVGQFLSYLVVVLCIIGMYSWIRYGMSTAYMDKSKASNGGRYNDETVDEIKMVIRILPFASFMIMWECAYDQLDANFQSIAQQCDLRVGNWVGDATPEQVPGASLGIFDPLTIIVLIPVLDNFIYPFYERTVGRPPSAFGKVLAGLIVSTLTMFWAGIFEVLRRNSGVINGPDGRAIVDRGSGQPMNHMHWGYAVPMYIMIAVAECLINVTAYELFYTEVPIYLKSTCQAINLFMVAMGSNLTSTFTLLFQNFIHVDNLNLGNFEYMYYTLGGLSVLNVIGYVVVMQWMEFGMNADEGEDSLYDDVNLLDSQGNDITQRQRHSSFESISLSRG